jgi:cell division protein FtsL
MLFRLIVVKTEAGLFELDFQVNHSNLRMISSTEKAILYSFLTIFDLLLIIFVLIDIYDSAEKIIKEEQAAAEQEKLKIEAENGTL